MAQHHTRRCDAKHDAQKGSTLEPVHDLLGIPVLLGGGRGSFSNSRMVQRDTRRLDAKTRTPNGSGQGGGLESVHDCLGVLGDLSGGKRGCISNVGIEDGTTGVMPKLAPRTAVVSQQGRYRSDAPRQKENEQLS